MAFVTKKTVAKKAKTIRKMKAHPLKGVAKSEAHKAAISAAMKKHHASKKKGKGKGSKVAGATKKPIASVKTGAKSKITTRPVKGSKKSPLRNHEKPGYVSAASKKTSAKENKGKESPAARATRLINTKPKAKKLTAQQESEARATAGRRKGVAKGKAKQAAKKASADKYRAKKKATKKTATEAK